MNVADVLDTFRNLKDEDIKMLEERYSYASYGNHKGIGREHVMILMRGLSTVTCWTVLVGNMVVPTWMM